MESDKEPSQPAEPVQGVNPSASYQTPLSKTSPDAELRSSVTPPPKVPKYRSRRVIIAVVVLVLALGAFVAFLVATTQSKAATKAAQSAIRVVKIGLLEPTSGDNVTIGNDRKRSIELAKKDLNLQNVKIEVVVRDSECDATAAVKGAKELINDEHVVAIIGDDCSTSTLAAAKVTDPAHVVLISPAATSAALTAAGDYVFRTVASDVEQGKFAATVLHKDAISKLAIIHEDGAYGEGLANSVTQNFVALGGTVVDTQVFPQSSIDVVTQLQHIKAQNPQAIYMISGDYSSDTAVFLKINELGLKAALYGSEALKQASWINDAGSVVEGLWITSIPDGTNTFVDHYRSGYNSEPNDYIANSYDAYTALALTIDSGANTGEQIKNALYKTSFTGASQATIKFDKNGDVSGSYEVVVVKNGKFELAN